MKIKFALPAIAITLIAAARGATPVGQIVALYDTILRDFARALAAQQAGNIEARVLELNHALLVIGHLQSILNHEHGGEAAKHFERFYHITRGMILEVNFRPTPEAFEKLIDKKTAVQRVAPSQLDQLLHPVFDTASLRSLTKLATGID